MIEGYSVVMQKELRGAEGESDDEEGERDVSSVEFGVPAEEAFGVEKTKVEDY